ncbi:hypothetical protein LTR28_005770, partial [Elasticomyces elasticus]
LTLKFGSLGFVAEGSTRPGPGLPGLRRNVNGESTENHIRPPAIRGIVTVIMLPGAPRAMATS